MLRQSSQRPAIQKSRYSNCNLLECNLSCRFNDEDDDLSYMESSYSQIEKEENKR